MTMNVAERKNEIENGKFKHIFISYLIVSVVLNCSSWEKQKIKIRLHWLLGTAKNHYGARTYLVFIGSLTGPFLTTLTSKCMYSKNRETWPLGTFWLQFLFVPMPTHCTITRFGFRSRRIYGIERGLFLNHALLGQTTLLVGRVSVSVYCKKVEVRVTVCVVKFCCVGWWFK